MVSTMFLFSPSRLYPKNYLMDIEMKDSSFLGTLLSEIFFTQYVPHENYENFKQVILKLLRIMYINVVYSLPIGANTTAMHLCREAYILSSSHLQTDLSMGTRVNLKMLL